MAAPIILAAGLVLWLTLLRRGLPEGPASATSGEIDLLKILDPKVDGIGRNWRREGGILVMPAELFARLQLPYVPPLEYDLKIVARRMDGKDSLNVGIALPGTQIVVVVDSDFDGRKSGLDRINGQPFHHNETTFKGALIETGKECSILIEVRRDRVRVDVDGKGIVDWKIDPSKASLFPNWQVAEAKALFIGCWKTVFHVSKISVKPLGRAGRLLR